MQTDRVPDRPDQAGPGRAAGSTRLRIARNRDRQCELYGAPLGDRVRRLTAALGVTQARLARALGLSPAMLSQLASARRVKIGDPAVLARLQLLDQRCGSAPPSGRVAVEALLDEVGCARLQWTARDVPSPRRLGDRGVPPARRTAEAVARRPPGRHVPAPAPGPADALRAVAPPARLAAAAATLAPAFPELAAVLREAAGHAGSGPRPASRRPW
jgi:hypothetical protein